MQTMNIAYIDVENLNETKLELNECEIVYSEHRDGCQEEELWIEISEEVIEYLSGKGLVDEDERDTIVNSIETVVVY